MYEIGSLIRLVVKEFSVWLVGSCQGAVRVVQCVQTVMTNAIYTVVMHGQTVKYWNLCYKNR